MEVDVDGMVNGAEVQGIEVLDAEEPESFVEEGTGAEDAAAEDAAAWAEEAARQLEVDEALAQALARGARLLHPRGTQEQKKTFFC